MHAAPRPLFPELVRACFELGAVVAPHRPPSSTIAVNRNAFKPHRDSGAGAGQTTSLIVGLGEYAGGELVVEPEAGGSGQGFGAQPSVNDVRYRPLEFDGWKQLHWTRPFQGERFSLVWFTPLGCEDKPGLGLPLGEHRENL